MQMSSRRPNSVASRAYPRIACIAIALLFTLSLGHSQSTPGKGASQQSVRGRQTFESSCAPCHGLNGKGSERAPDIVAKPQIVRLTDAQLLKVLRLGKPQAGMPGFALLGEKRLTEVLDYVRALQGKRKAPTATAGDSIRGKEIFANKAGCSGCHTIRGIGGFIGPELSDYGANHSSDEIRNAILSADKRMGTRKTLAKVTTKNGQRISGLVRNEDNFSLQLQSLDGTFHLLEKSTLTEFELDSAPVMPSDYGTKLSKEELDQVAAYLLSLAEAKQ